MLGNELNTDSLGFIKDGANDPALSHIITRIKSDLSTGHISKAKIDLKATSNCWICEGWTSVLFKWNPYEQAGEEGKIIANLMNENTMVYIHLSSDNNQADLMEKDDQTGEFTLLRMVPPTKITYYFSIAEAPLANQGATSFTKSFLNQRMIEVPGTNIIENIIQTRQIVTKTYLEDLTVIPRPLPKKVKGLRRVKTPWDVKNSMFRDYVPDNELIL